MAEPPKGPAVFSTKCGRFQYKPARNNVPCIVRSDYWEDVQSMAISLKQKFPEYCQPMTLREVQVIENYFDPYDIQMHSRAFLVHVLELIVAWNMLGAINEVNQFAARWKEENPEAYQALLFNSSIEDVFSDLELRSVKRDILESALNIMIKSRYPEGKFPIYARQ